jgi:hypothetical protein
MLATLSSPDVEKPKVRTLVMLLILRSSSRKEEFPLPFETIIKAMLPNAPNVPSP